MRIRFSRSIIYTCGRKEKVCKKIKVFTLIYTWEWSNLGHKICKVRTGFAFFIRFGLLLKGNPFYSE